MVFQKCPISMSMPLQILLQQLYDHVMLHDYSMYLTAAV